MKLFALTAFATALSLGSLAHAQEINSISAKNIHALSTVDVNGDGQRDKVMIVSKDDGEAKIMIFAGQENGSFQLAVKNSQLGLTTDGISGVGSRLTVDEWTGSIKITSYNDAVGRFRYERTLTVAYRNGDFVLAGFTLSHRDTIDTNSGGSCDYNLLTGRGVRNGKKVTFKPSMKKLKDLQDDEKSYTCDL